MKGQRKPSHRIIEGLKWAKMLGEKEWPRGIPRNPRLRGSRLGGIAYEKIVHKALLQTEYWPLRGRWFEYEDKNGHGFCQPDIIFSPFIVECKLSDAHNGRLQLSQLYLPVVEMALGQPHLGLVCIKHMTPKIKASQVCRNLSFALKLAELGREIPILFYLGKGPI